MRKVRAGWLTLILTLFVLWVPVTASADKWGPPGGGTDPGGDPDYPMGPQISPGWRSSGNVAGDTGRPSQWKTDRVWLKRYLTLWSGLRGFYLRF